MDLIKSENLTNLENKNVAIFGSGSSAKELISSIYSLNIRPRKITLFDSFRSGHLDSNFGSIEIIKKTEANNLSEYDLLIIASINWDQIVSQWKSDFPESWFVETNELIHFANPISKLGDFYINDSIRSRFEHVLSLISKNLVDEKSKNLLDMIFDLRCGGSEHSFFKLMLEMNLVFRTKYESFTKKRSYDLIIDGGIFDGNEIQIFREMLEDHGQYRGFEPNSDLISAKNREILEADNRLIIHNFALWDKCETLRFNSSLGAASNIIGDLNRSIESVKEISAVTLDEMFEGVSGKRVLIKLDIEGAEMNALRGGANFFQRNNVDFAISIYHKANDLMEIPEFILNLEKNYAYSFGVSNPTFVDWVFYAIEKRED